MYRPAKSRTEKGCKKETAGSALYCFVSRPSLPFLMHYPAAAYCVMKFAAATYSGDSYKQPGPMLEETKVLRC